MSIIRFTLITITYDANQLSISCMQGSQQGGGATGAFCPGPLVIWGAPNCIMIIYIKVFTAVKDM